MQYRKKPVVIEAEQYRSDLPLPFSSGDEKTPLFVGDGMRVYVETVEGPLHVSEGDWIIRGSQGEFYPCKPDIFALTYEAVS